MDSDSEGSYGSSSHSDSSHNYYQITSEKFEANLLRIRENNPHVTRLDGNGEFESVQEMTDDDWEELGRDISNNTHLTKVGLSKYALHDHQMQFLFRGLTRSGSITDMILQFNNLSAAAVRCMVPFLQNANNLARLDLSGTVFQSEGFNLLLRALRNSPIERLDCSACDIESIEEIDSENKPKNLEKLFLNYNHINADGCRGLAKLLRGGDSTLTTLDLDENKIDDEGVAILVGALQSNTSLMGLQLAGNVDISNQGLVMLLKLVNDISSIEATLRSNHTLTKISLEELRNVDPEFQRHIGVATQINMAIADLLVTGKLGAASREKMIKTQLNSVKRAKLAELQGVNHSLYSEVNPLHLPEVLSLVGNNHGQGELYVALKSSIAGVISTVNRKECLKQQRGYHNAIIAEHSAKVEAINAELEAIEAAEGSVLHIGSESHSNKRRRI